MLSDDPLYQQMKDDFQEFDLLEELTLSNRDPGTDTFTDYGTAIIGLARRGQELVEAPHGVQVAFSNQLVFHFAVDDDEYTVANRDKIIREDGTEWIVGRVQKQSADTRWRVTCLKAL